MLVIAFILAVPLCRIFVGYDEGLYKITLRAFLIYSISYVVTGYNIFGSSFFTALNNGPVSAVISFLRTLVFQTASVLLLPEIFKLDGVWMSVIVAEVLSAVVTTVFLIAKRKRYNY
jgi:Na+-driven multidrug efflux pump